MVTPKKKNKIGVHFIQFEEMIAIHFTPDKSNLRKIFFALETINKISQAIVKIEGLVIL